METPVSLLEQLRTQPSANAWNRLVDLYTPFLHDWLRSFALQPADADDLVQEILKTLVAEVATFRHSGKAGAFRSWLKQIARHRLLMFWRDERRRAAAPVDLDRLAAPAGPLERYWDQEHDRRVATRLFELLEAEFRPATVRAFRRFVMERIPAEIVAQELDISVNAVYIAKSRVLSRLRQEIRGVVDE